MGKVNEYQCGKFKGSRRRPPADTDLDVVSARPMICAADAAASPRGGSVTSRIFFPNFSLVLLSAERDALFEPSVNREGIRASIKGDGVHWYHTSVLYHGVYYYHTSEPYPAMRSDPGEATTYNILLEYL